MGSRGINLTQRHSCLTPGWIVTNHRQLKSATKLQYPLSWPSADLVQGTGSLVKSRATVSRPQTDAAMQISRASITNLRLVAESLLELSK